MHWKIFAAGGLLMRQAAAQQETYQSSSQAVKSMFRFGCNQLTIERADPLVSPGITAPHTHQVVGGNSFNLTV